MTVCVLIRFISEHSNRYGDKLIDFMERYGLHNLASATEEQLTEYINREFTVCAGGCLRNYAEPLKHCRECSFSASKNNRR